MSNLKKVSTNLFRDKSTNIYYIIARRGGKRIKEPLNTTDRTVASLRLHDKLAELPDPASTANIDATWGDIKRDYIAIELPCRRLKPKSLEDRLLNIENIERDWDDLADTKLRTIKESDCKKWLVERLKRRKAGEQRINNEIGAMKQIFDLAVTEKIILRNPAAKLKRLPIHTKEKRMPEKTEFEAVLADLRLRRLDDSADLIELLAYSGMRLGEARELLWEDIDWQRNRFLVTGGETGTKNWDTKSRPLFPKLRKLLQTILQRRGGNASGKIIHILSAKKSLETTCKRVGCPKLNHHAMRHLFITTALEAGINITMIAKWVNHKDGGVLLLKRYGHIRNEAETDAANLLR